VSGRTFATRTFRALHNRNYRFFFFGQVVSVSGTWMQSVGQAWLVLKLTNSGTALGLVLALQTLPLLLGGAWGGVLADRFDKRRVLVITQSAAATVALTLGLLTVTGVVQLWMVCVLAVAFGAVNMIDLPTRQAFIHEMVGRENLVNAVSLNAVIMNGARVVGPALAAVVIATAGIGPCFLLNAASYLAVIAGLLAIRKHELHRVAQTQRAPGQLIGGLRYVWATPTLRVPLLTMAVVGTFAYEFQVSLPLIARFTFNAGASGYGALSSFMGAGAVLGGLVTAALARPTSRRLAIATATFGFLILAAAAAPTLPIMLGLIAATGAASIFFGAMANTSIQLAAEPRMRGRVMALYTVAFMGSTAVGGPIVGLIGQVVSPRAALATGGLACLLTAILAWRSLSGMRTAPPATQVGLAPA